MTLTPATTPLSAAEAREPLMELSEADITAAIDSLKTAGLVRESSGGRAARFEHNAQRGVDKGGPGEQRLKPERRSRWR